MQPICALGGRIRLGSTEASSPPRGSNPLLGLCAASLPPFSIWPTMSPFLIDVICGQNHSENLKAIGYRGIAGWEIWYLRLQLPHKPLAPLVPVTDGFERVVRSGNPSYDAQATPKSPQPLGAVHGRLFEANHRFAKPIAPHQYAYHWERTRQSSVLAAIHRCKRQSQETSALR